MTEPTPEFNLTEAEKLGRTLFGELWPEISRWWRDVTISIENETT